MIHTIEQYPIAQAILAAKGWDNTLRQLMLSAKALTVLPDSQRIPTHKIAGCQSHVWLLVTPEDGKLTMQSFSDSKMIRGVLAVLEEFVTSHRAELITKDAINTHLRAINLEAFLSESRANGIRYVVDALVKHTA